MNDSTQSAPVVKLISQIIGQELSAGDVSPPVIFITAVLYVLNGVIFADQSVEEEEKARLEKIINNLCPEGSQARDLAQVINENIQQQGLYHNINNLDILTEEFSESDKLLILSLGYEMSMADGSLDKTEKRHLKTIGIFLELNDQFHSFLESLFVNPNQLDTDILKEFTNLLDPARFHHLDEIFVFAANQVLDQIPGYKKPKEAKPLPRNIVESFEELERFKVRSNSLQGIFERTKLILDSIRKNSFIPESVFKNADVIEKSFKHLQEFKIAVIGDFSQGKSTLLNVILGEEIQPVRSIPCSGTITALKYGDQKKVTCFYKDGTSEIIPFHDYQNKASIEKNAALDNAAQGLFENLIQKIVVEHPNLAFCKQGVEILDSPGLNEHPERSAITQQLLYEVDVAIFMTDASRPMTRSEQEVIKEILSIMNVSSENNTADNLFVVVNKWDLLRKENDRQEVQERIENIFLKKAIISDNNRIHYLSSQEALNAILEGAQNEYLTSFENFVYALETFLGNERGGIKIKQISHKINSLIDSALIDLEKSKDILTSKSEDTEKEKKEIIDQIGEITGRDIKIKNIVNEIFDDTIDEVSNSYSEWLDILPDKLANSAQNWSSEHGAIMSRDKLIADYANQFNRDLSNEFNEWINKKLKNRILKRSIRELRQAVKDELKSLEKAGHLGLSDSDSSDSFNYSFDDYNLEDVGIGFDLLFAGLGLVVGVPVFIIAGPIVAGIAAALGGGSIFNAAFKMLDLDDTIRGKVFQIGLENFFESSERTDKINEIVHRVFENESLLFKNFIKDLIYHCENSIQLIDQKNKEDQQQNKFIIDKAIGDLQQIKFSFD